MDEEGRERREGRKGGRDGGREEERRGELLPCQLLSRGCLEHTSP